MISESPHWWNRLAPRCWLVASWIWRGIQWFGCSPINAVRELSLERCEAVRFISTRFTIILKVYLLVRKDLIFLTNCF